MRRYKAIIIILVSYIAFSMFRLSLGVALPEIMKEFLINETLAGILYSASFYSSALLLLPAGYLADLYGREKMLFVGYLILTVGVFCSSISPRYFELFVSLTLAGAGAGLLIPPYYSIVGETLKEVRGFAVGLATGVFNLGGLLGSLTMGFFVAQYNWRLAFVVMGIIILLLTFIQFKVVKTSTQSKEKISYSIFPRLLKERVVIIASISILIGSITFSTAAAWLPTYFITSIGLNPIETGFAFGLFLFIGFFGSLALGALSDKIGRRSAIFITGIVATAISIAIFSFTSSSVLTIILLSITLGFFVSPYWNLFLTSAQELVRGDVVSSVTGLVLCFGFIGIAVGPVIAGLLIPIYGLNQTLLCLIALPSTLYALLGLISIKG